MSKRYPHSWAPGYIAEAGELVGYRATPSGKLLYICQRCGAETPGPCRDRYEGDCPGAKIQEQAWNRPYGVVRIDTLAARVMHAIASMEGRVYSEEIQRLIDVASRDPAVWTQTVMAHYAKISPQAYEQLLSEVQGSVISALRNAR